MRGFCARIFAAVGVGALLLGAATNSQAGVVYTFTQANAPSGLPDGGNYGTVTLDDHSTDPSVAIGSVRFVLKANPGGATFGSFGFNSNLSSATLLAATYSNSPANWKADAFFVPAHNKFGPFGDFSVALGKNKNTGRVAIETIIISGLSASDANIAHFQFPSTSASPAEGSVFFVAHYNPPNGGSTGFVGAREQDKVHATPAPSALLMGVLGAASCGLIGLRRLRLKPQGLPAV